jgi:hypothetical protein
VGKSQRDKGKRGELMAAEVMRCVYPDARRGRQDRFGTDAPDVEGTPWWIEVKIGKAPPVWPAWKQATTATDGRPPLVIVRRDREEALAVLRLTDLVAILSNQKA